MIQSGLLVAADTGIEAEARSEAEADLEQIADQGNDNSQTATPTVAFTAAPIFGTAQAMLAANTDRCRCPAVVERPGGVAVAVDDDVEIEAGIEDVDIDVSQEQEDIDQENEAEQDGAAYATADYSGDVFVEQSGTLTAGTLLSDGAGGFTPEGDGIDASSVADAEADLEQVAVQSNSNSQAITEDALPTPAFAFTADAAFNSVGIGARDDAEIEAGIEDVEVELEQEQEDIDQDNSAEQDGEAEAYAYSGEVDVEQTGDLFAAEDGIDATSRAEASAELEQQAGQDNLNAQSAATSLAIRRVADVRNRPQVMPPASVETGFRFSGGVAVVALDDAEIEAGIDDVEVSVEQEQEEIEQENEADQEGDVDATAYSGDVTVISGLDEKPRDPVAGDTGIDASSEADADASLEQLADQSNTNAQAATTTGNFSASAAFTGVAIAVGTPPDDIEQVRRSDIEIEAGIEDVEVEVDQDQEDIDQSNDADQNGRDLCHGVFRLPRG